MLKLSSLTNATYSFDFSLNVESHNFNVIPSFSFNELCNGNLSKKRDLGNTSDKFYSDIEVCLDFTKYQSFISFYELTKTDNYSIETDLDLFFPNIYTYTSCKIVEVRNLGYLGGDIFSRNTRLLIRLYLTQTLNYTSVSDASAILNRGVWEQDYTYSAKFLTSDYGIQSWKLDFNNDVCKWTVELPYMKKATAATLLAWILTLRTNSANLTLNDLNGNLKGNKNDPMVMSFTSDFKLESFEFKNENRYYSASLSFVGMYGR